ESKGILAFQFPMGSDSCRGFSLWDETAPAVAVNTAWNPAARSFTLLHELGHLVTRTSSACLEGWGRRRENEGDQHERWCESFAASVLAPWDQVERFL